MKSAQEIGRDLRIVRGERTRQAVAKELGISESAIGMYETGKRIPKDEIKMKLAKCYGVSIEDLFFGRVLTDSEDEV